MSEEMPKVQVVKNVMSTEMLEWLRDGLLMIRECVHNNKSIPIDDYTTLGDFCGPTFHRYGGVLTDTLLLKFLPLMEEKTGKKLYPAYSYWRIYYTGSSLPPHSDRPACEYSITMTVDQDGPDWPISIDGEPVTLKPGDIAIYNGHKLRHWRETYEGKRQIQVFFHYVDQNGPNAIYKYDQRPVLGLGNMHMLDKRDIVDSARQVIIPRDELERGEVNRWFRRIFYRIAWNLGMRDQLVERL